MLDKCGGCKNENPRWVSWITGKLDTTQYCDKCGSNPTAPNFGDTYYQKQTIGWDSEGPLKMSAAELNDIKSRHVNPDGSVTKVKRSYTIL